MQELELKYDGTIPSNNKYKAPAIRKMGKKTIPYMYETAESKNFKKEFKKYLKQVVKDIDWNIDLTIGGHWYLDLTIFQNRTNQDNNNVYKVLCDAMSKIIFNDDKNVLVRTQRVYYDMENPRFEIEISHVDYIGIWDNKDQYEQFIDNCKKCRNYKNGKCGRLNDYYNYKITNDLDFENMVCHGYKEKKPPKK